ERSRTGTRRRGGQRSRSRARDRRAETRRQAERSAAALRARRHPRPERSRAGHARVQDGRVLCTEGRRAQAVPRTGTQRARQALSPGGTEPGRSRSVPQGARKRSERSDVGLPADSGTSEDRQQGRDPGPAQASRAASREGDPAGARAEPVQAHRRRQGNRRTFVRISLASAASVAAERVLAQGIASHTAKPLPKPPPSGRPFHARFVDVAAAAGLTAPVVYGALEGQKYILEAIG